MRYSRLVACGVAISGLLLVFAFSVIGNSKTGGAPVSREVLSRAVGATWSYCVVCTGVDTCDSPAVAGGATCSSSFDFNGTTAVGNCNMTNGPTTKTTGCSTGPPATFKSCELIGKRCDWGKTGGGAAKCGNKQTVRCPTTIVSVQGYPVVQCVTEGGLAGVDQSLLKCEYDCK